MKKLNLQIKGSAENMKLEKKYIYFKDETREPQLKIDNLRSGHVCFILTFQFLQNVWLPFCVEQSRVFRFSITDYSLILFLPLL